jgi:3-hydroxyacyl-[acyl-carrier-protein] dehydratase
MDVLSIPLLWCAENQAECYGSEGSLMDRPIKEPARPHAILGHAFPFVMLDRVYEIESGRSGKGQKMISCDDFLARDETYPRCLLVEVAAQLSGIVSGKEQGGMLAGLKDIFFLHDVFPGDVVEFRASVKGSFGGLYSFSVEASRGGDKVMVGEIYLAVA